MQLPATPTPLNMGQVKSILRREYSAIHGEPMRTAEPYLLAMVALENRRGGAILNHNWGNVIVPAYLEGSDFYMVPDNPRHFIVRRNHAEGARFFLKTLNSETNRRILNAARRDDFEAFFQGITTPHPKTRKAYCPDCGPAKATYRALVNEFKGQQTTQGHTQGGGGALPLLLLLAAGYGIRRYLKSKKRG